MTRASRPVRSALAALAAALLLGPGGAGAAWGESWYVSNRLGMKLEGIPRFRADEFDYVLREADEGGATVLTLYGSSSRAGATPPGAPAGTEEVSRWERRPAPGGRIEELRYERGTHASTALYRADGRLERETLFEGGAAVEELSYRYSGGLLRTVESRSPSGELIGSTDYFVSPAGLLRGTRRTGSEPESAAFSFAGRRLAEETLESPAHVVVLRYDAEGRRVVWEVLGTTHLVRGTYSEYDRSSGLIAREEERRGAEERVERVYDAKGRLAEEREYRGDALVATVTHRYDAADRLVATERRGEQGIELATFGYRPDGGLEWEEHRKRGSLRSRIVYTGPSTRYEEIVQSDGLSVRAWYEGEEKVREEVLRDGKVLRERAPAGNR